MKLSFRNAVALTMALSLRSFASAGILQEHQGQWRGGMKVPDAFKKHLKFALLANDGCN